MCIIVMNVADFCLYHDSYTFMMTIYLPIIVPFFVTNEYRCKNEVVCRHEMLNISSTRTTFEPFFFTLRNVRSGTEI